MEEGSGLKLKLKPVVASFERNERGARFNVETVTPALENKFPLSEIKGNLEAVRGVADKFYSAGERFGKKSNLHVRIEASSVLGKDHPTLIGYNLASSLFEASFFAFDRHLPLSITPDSVWVLITYAFARHVDENAEALRSKFVSHEGKKVLEVRIDDFVKGQTPPEMWEQRVFPDFSDQIKTHIGETTHSVIANSFTTSTATDRACHEITLMAAMKNYFSYKVSADCSCIPHIYFCVRLTGLVLLKCSTCVRI